MFSQRWISHILASILALSFLVLSVLAIGWVMTDIEQLLRSVF